MSFSAHLLQSSIVANVKVNVKGNFKCKSDFEIDIKFKLEIDFFNFEVEFNFRN